MARLDRITLGTAIDTKPMIAAFRKFGKVMGKMGEAMALQEGDKVLDESLVTFKGSKASKGEYLESLEQVVTQRYMDTVQKAFPWMKGLTLSKDDDEDWFAIYTRDGEKETCHLGGTTFPQFPDDFIKCVQRQLAGKIDLSKMDKVASDLGEWNDTSDDDDSDDDDGSDRAHDGADDDNERPF